MPLERREEIAFDAQLAISPAAAYRIDGRDDPIVRVSFGGEGDSAVVATGMRRLAALLAQ